MNYTKNFKFEFNCAGMLHKKLIYEIIIVGLSERFIVHKKFRNGDLFGIILEKT